MCYRNVNKSNVIMNSSQSKDRCVLTAVVGSHTSKYNMIVQMIWQQVLLVSVENIKICMSLKNIYLIIWKSINLIIICKCESMNIFFILLHFMHKCNTKFVNLISEFVCQTGGKLRMMKCRRCLAWKSKVC